MANNEIVFDVVEGIGTIAKYPTGWKKEVNLISWNNGPAKVDIRDWDPDHLHMSKGITLHDDEARKLLALLKNHFAGAPNQSSGNQVQANKHVQDNAEQNSEAEAPSSENSAEEGTGDAETAKAE